MEEALAECPQVERPEDPVQDQQAEAAAMCSVTETNLAEICAPVEEGLVGTKDVTRMLAAHWQLQVVAEALLQRQAEAT